MKFFKLLPAFTCLLATSSYAADNINASALKSTVDHEIKALMKKEDIAGMAVAVIVDGKNYFYNYGVASKQTKQPVTSSTLFEIGSVSKTFTATLAAYAEVHGQLALTDPVSKYVPYLQGSSFDHIRLVNLGTHTAGDFPLQIPDGVETTDQLMDYYKNWNPGHAPGTTRTYSNPGIALLGVATARSMQMPFADAMEKKLFPALGLQHSYIHVPAGQMKNYAQGYNEKNEPVRVNPGVLAEQAYGVKTDSADLIRYVAVNMGLVTVSEDLRRAINATHVGYFKSGELVQDLMWEQYPDTAPLAQLLAGNSADMIFDTHPATELTPPTPPQADVLINKTGSTGGFGAYALYAPAKQIGIVILANRSYPLDERVTAAFHILTQLESQAHGGSAH